MDGHREKNVADKLLFLWFIPRHNVEHCLSVLLSVLMNKTKNCIRSFYLTWPASCEHNNKITINNFQRTATEILNL